MMCGKETFGNTDLTIAVSGDFSAQGSEVEETIRLQSTPREALQRWQIRWRIPAKGVTCYKGVLSPCCTTRGREQRNAINYFSYSSVSLPISWPMYLYFCDYFYHLFLYALLFSPFSLVTVSIWYSSTLYLFLYSYSLYYPPPSSSPFTLYLFPYSPCSYFSFIISLHFASLSIPISYAITSSSSHFLLPLPFS